MKKVFSFFLSLIVLAIQLNAQWTELSGSNSLSANSPITSICIDESRVGELTFAAGTFTNSNGYRYVAECMGPYDNRNWTELGGENTSTFNNDIYSLYSDPNSGRLIAAGAFTNDSGKYYVAVNNSVWNNGGWTELGGLNSSTFNGNIYAICSDAAGNIYVGGGFTNINGQYYIAKWNGNSWSELGGINSLGANSDIRSICIDPSGNLYAAGSLMNSAFKRYVAKWNGSSWSELGGLNSLNANGTIYSICSDTWGNIYAAGGFVNASFKYYVAKYDSTGWNELGGVNTLSAQSYIYSICSDDFGDIYAGGLFENSNNKKYIAKYNGAVWSELGGKNSLGVNGDIKTLYCDKRNGINIIYAGGAFANENSNYYVADYIPASPSITSFTPSTGYFGSEIIIKGLNFTDTKAVIIEGIAALSFVILNDSTISAVVGNGSSGSIIVLTNGGNSRSLTSFTYCNPTTATITKTTCSSYTWHGNTYTNSGIYNFDTLNAKGCDSLTTLKLTVNATSSSTNNISVCSSTIPFIWNGTAYSVAGTYTKTLLNAVGCDSVATLNLSILNCSSRFTWTGNISTDWNVAGNWSNNLIPTSTSSVTISSIPINKPIITSDIIVDTLSIDGTLSLNGHTLTLNGAVTGTGSFKGSATSSVIIGGTVGNISFDANNNSLQNLTINGTTTLGNTLNLYGKLTVNTGGTLTTGGNLTLKSVSTGTAVVEPVNGNISGNVKVERYIPQGYSAHRDLGVCVLGAGSITNTWGDSLKNYLVYNYNSASGWTTIPNSSSLNKYIGYRVLISGHNNPIVPTAYISYMNSDVTLAYSGTLLTGNQSIPLTTGSDKFSFVSNPYASQVDFNALSKSGLYDGYWYLDPTTLYGTYENYNYYGSNIGVSNVYAKSAAQYLQSGQGFFVCSNSATPTLTFTESAKNNGNTQAAIFGATTQLNRIATGLFANGKNLDGAVVVFNNNFTNGISKEDGLKINNQGENLTISVAGKELCANGWSMPTATDELQIHLYQLNKSTAYSLRLDASQFIGNGLNAYLKDNLLNTQTLLKGDSNVISYATSTDTFSNRFSIVFKPTTLPVKSISATATLLKGNQVTIKWNVVGEINVVSYQIERSNDGINFTSIITTAPNSSNNYSYTDASAIINTNYYRIKAIDNVGGACFSNVASVDLNNQLISVIPNPIVNKSFKIGLQAVRKYTVSLVNKSGQIVYSTQLNHSVDTTLENIVIGKPLTAGSYTITATDESGKAISTEVIIQ